MIKLSAIIKGMEFKDCMNFSDIDIVKVREDSREVATGDLFIAVNGASQDGARFIQDAIKRGASAIVSEKDFPAPGNIVKIIVSDTRKSTALIADNYFNAPSGKLKTVGITGTNGKTTITYLMESIVRAYGKYSGVIGTINHRIKDRIMPAKNTTPGPLLLQGLMAEMVREEVDYSIMEVSSHALDQGRVDNILFDAGVFTNISSDHLDYHKTHEKYFNAKRRLFDKLKPGGSAILNADDEKVMSLKRFIKNRVFTFSLKSEADIMAMNIRTSAGKANFMVKTPDSSFMVNSQLIGMHNVSNILATIAVAISLNIPEAAIVEGIQSLSVVPGRLESVDMGQDFKVFVDFAHTEDALFNVLTLLKGLQGKRIITVFGCGGNRDRSKRPLMGKMACHYSDRAIITSDNPRFEDPHAIIDEIEKGVRGLFNNYDTIVDRKEAITKAIRLASCGDIVLIAGKGHENYQIIGDKIEHFDDREIALNALKLKGI